MKLNKQISELVQTDFVPVEETKEGLLRGGFGEVESADSAELVVNNCDCKGNNCVCYGNDCGPATTTTTSTSKGVDGIQFEF